MPILPFGIMWPYPAVPIATLDSARLAQWKAIGISLTMFAPPVKPAPTIREGNETQMCRIAQDLGMLVIRTLPENLMPPYSDWVVGARPIRKLRDDFQPATKGAVGGYQLFHEIYGKLSPPHLEQAITVIRQKDPHRLIVGTGNLAVQRQNPDFAHAFFQDPSCLYAHESYYNQVGKPVGPQIGAWRAELLPKGGHQIPGVGTWWAVLYVGDEWIHGRPYLQAPTPKQLRLWYTTALTIGASGFWLFPGSSMDVGERRYKGLDEHEELWPEVSRLADALVTQKYTI